MRPSMQIATAVAAALSAASGLAVAAPPTLAQAAAAPNTLYIAGSSAAKPGILKALQINLCGGATNALTINSTGNTNFTAVSCTPTLAGAPAGVTTVYYRTEGGSVVGALPIVTGKAIATLDLTNAGGTIACTATTCTAPVTGSSAANGISDTFTGNVVKHTVQLGITDVEPGALTGNNYPSAYQTSAYGKATTSQMQGLAYQTLFGQAFGVFVNTNSAAFSASEKNNGATPGVLNISKAALTNVLQGNVTNWNSVPDTSGNAVAGSQAITIVNREQGSGSRASVDMFFTGDGCQSGATPIKEVNPTSDFFSTGNVLTAANTTPGSVTYASIDNFNTTTFPNLVLVNVDGISPSNLTAASGQYGLWYEATAVLSPTLSGNSLALANIIIGVLQDIASEPHLVDVIAIPGNSNNTAALPVSSTADGSPAIYVNAYTRAGVSCAAPSSAL